MFLIWLNIPINNVHADARPLIGGKNMKEDKKKENNIEMKEFISALYKLIIAKTESLEDESKLNKQFMKDHGINAKAEFDSKQDWPENFNDEWS